MEAKVFAEFLNNREDDNSEGLYFHKKPTNAAHRSVGLAGKSRDELISEFNQQREYMKLMIGDKDLVSVNTDLSDFELKVKKKRKEKRKKKTKHGKKQQRYNKRHAHFAPLFINKLRKCGTYTNKQLVGRIVVIPNKMTALHMIIEDDFESEVVYLSIYNDRNEHKYKKGTKVLIQEPFYKVSQDQTYRIRVDDPSTVKILSNKVPFGANEKSANDWKDLANKCFAAKDYKVAMLCYSKGIQYYDDKDVTAAALLSNRSLCYIKQNKYKQALIDVIASKYIRGNIFKIWQREMLCWSKLNQHQVALHLWKEAIIKFPDKMNVLRELEKKWKLKLNAKSVSAQTVNVEYVVLGDIIQEVGKLYFTEHESQSTGNDLKECGNKQFAEGKYEEALKIYTYGLRKHYNVLSVLLSNRAVCWMKLRKYKKAFMDASISVIVDENNVKGWFRRSMMSYKLNLSAIGNTIIRRYSKNESFAKLLEKYKCTEPQIKQHLASNQKINAGSADLTSLYNNKISKASAMKLFNNRNNSTSAQRIHHVLRFYDNWIQTRNKCAFSFALFMENELDYHHHDVLNDFHHILQLNDDMNDSDKHLCESSECMYICRNRANQSVNNINDSDQIRRNLYFDYSDSVNCTLFQTLDIVHAAMYHKDINREKASDKFVINMDFEDEDEKTTNNVTYHSFGFGEPFVYYDQLRASGIKIKPFYKTLEDEMLNNPYYKFTKQQYDDIYIKADSLLKTDLFKDRIKARYCGDGERIGIIEGDMLSINHIISLLIYCNETEAQRIFKEQCRKSNYNETVQHIKKKHSYIAHWMRYLWDATRIFGVLCKQNEVIYTGMNKKLLFTSFSNHYYAPLSTSADIVVAQNFATQNGIILKLKHCQEFIRYFDMMPISNFVHEKEKFFLSAKLEIIDIIIDTISYLKEVSALKLMERIISGQLFFNPCNPELLTENVQLQLIEFIVHYLKNTNYEPGSNLNYMQTMFNNMMANYLKPENYHERKMKLLDNDTFHIFIDREEIQRLNPSLVEYFYCMKQMRKKQNNPKYGMLLKRLHKENKRGIHLCCNHIILPFSKQKLKQLRNEKNIGPMRHCYATDIIVQDPNANGKQWTFLVRFCKAKYEDGDQYEIFIKDLTERDHQILLYVDFLCKEIKHQQIAHRTILNFGTEYSFIGFLCQEINALSELEFILNFRILEL